MIEKHSKTSFRKDCNIYFTSDESKLSTSNFHIVTVPTPINEFKKPDFKYIISASEILAKLLKKNDIIVYESTVYPGATEEIAIPILEKISGMKINRDFSVGYSPERINPADPNHRFENIKKVVSATNLNALKIIEKVYGSVVKAGIYVASSIKVAEAAKVIENTQRDLNIALMNELVKIFDAMDISTNEVLEAASTKWNFLNFHPGLVGGHCIGVDPYYLIHKSQQIGVIPDLLISARKINDSMSSYFSMKIFNILNEKKVELYEHSDFSIIVTSKNSKFPIHDDIPNKLLSGVIYLSPQKNSGTSFYNDKKGSNKTNIDWKTNRAVFFSRKERETWHSYEGDKISNRVALVYNLMTNNIKEVYNIEKKNYFLGNLRFKLNPYIYQYFNKFI